MSTTITLSDRGVITLPAALRRAAGLKANDQLVAEATADGGILLRPAITLPIEAYSDKRIAEFDAAEAELGDFFVGRAERTASKVSAKARK